MSQAKESAGVLHEDAEDAKSVPKAKIASAIRDFSGSAQEIEDLGVLADSGELVLIESRIEEDPSISVRIERSENPHEFDFILMGEHGIEKIPYTHRPTQKHPRE